MGYDDTGRKATNKYREKYEFIQIRLTKEEKVKIIEYTKKTGESINGFVKRAIEQMINIDKGS